MMFRTVFLKTLYSLRWQLLGWSLGMAVIAYMTLVLYPSFNQQGIENIVNSVPDSLKSLFGDVADFKTIPGYIGQQIFGPNLYIVSLVMTIIVFLSVSANEEADGRLQTLLSLPLTRSSIYFQKWLAAALTVCLITCMVFIGILLALLTIHDHANLVRVWQSIFELCLVSVAFGTIAFALAFFTGSKTITILVGSVYTVAAFFVSSLAPSVSKLKLADKFSLLHYYNNPQIMAHSINTHHVWIMLGCIAVLICIGWLGFLRRDVATA